MKLKVPATQRHHRERAACARWLAISQVRFLYGLPVYKKLSASRRGHRDFISNSLSLLEYHFGYAYECVLLCFVWPVQVVL